MATNIVVDNITDDDITQCTKHPFKNTSPSGGICPFCLQDKLGKLVSSSSFSPSFRSDLPSTSSQLNKPHLPFIVTPKKKPPSNLVLSRSKSTTTHSNDFSTPRRRGGFWSFLHFPLKKTTSTSSTIPKPPQLPTSAAAPPSTSSSSVQVVVLDDNDNDNGNDDGSSPNTTSFERKVTRSRSVGCGGSRSFSVDLLDRISTGFGDCALRRVESQREGGRMKHRHSTSNAMRCGGLFGGFMMIASSSSSTSTTSSSSYWVDGNGPRPNGIVHGRSRTWGWALASPRKVFGVGATKVVEKNNNNNNDVDDTKSKMPNLDAIPSLLSVRS